MRIVGINCLTHDVSVALIEDGKILAAVEEERFTGIKHQGGILSNGKPPLNSLKWIFDKFNLKPKDIDFFAYSGDLNQNIGLADFITKYRRFAMTLDPSLSKSIFLDHHLCHASSTFRCSGFDQALILTIDGEGDSVSTTMFIGEFNEIKKIASFPANQSLGHFYTSVTKTLGLGSFGAEGKTMGLSNYGSLDSSIIDKNIIKKTNLGYIINDNYNEILLNYKRYGSDISDEHKNLAATAQYLLEDTIIHLIKLARKEYEFTNVCIAGGVGLNCLTNSKISKLDFVKNVFIQPAANDAGTSIGAALEVFYQKNSINIKSIAITNVYYGPEYSNDDIKSILEEYKIKYEYIENICDIASDMLVDGKIIGWFQGKMEFGPRALGNRSILANPSIKGINDLINKKIKHRELWRPFAPAILESQGNEYFYDFFPSPFMTFTFNIKENKINDIPAVAHIDGSARVQSVSLKNNKLFFNLLKSFNEKTNIPVLLNTSFNDKGQPIVRTPKEAIATFYSTGLDALVIGNYLICK